MENKYFYSNTKKCFAIEPKDNIKRQNKWEYLKENGFFDADDSSTEIDGRLNHEMVQNALANTLQVTFEVTESCNLDCVYCGYGELYNRKSNLRSSRDLPLEYAVNLIDYLYDLWNSDKNKSFGKKVSFGFYGGEPLLKADFIKKVVLYVDAKKSKRITPRFSMTTNALLLKKHINFLIEYDFHILISLDGNKENNSYRIYKNKEEAFDEIISNIDFVYKNHPDFFKKNIRFNSVLHNRNSVSDAFKFIYNRYNVKPTISELSTSGVEVTKEEEFWSKYSNAFESLNQSEDYRFIREKLFINSPDISATAKFLLSYSNNIYKKYIDFFEIFDNVKYLPTGTCIPFSRKVFLTARGTVMQCERVSDKIPFGHVNEKGVVIDSDLIIKMTNDIYDKLRKYCSNCGRVKNCSQCIFKLNLNADKLNCPGFIPSAKINQIFNTYLSLLNKDQGLYKEIIKDVNYE